MFKQGRTHKAAIPVIVPASRMLPVPESSPLGASVKDKNIGKVMQLQKQRAENQV